MELIRPDTKIDFLRYRGVAAAISLACMTVGVIALVVRGGPNLGIDFAGGSLVQARFASPVKIGDVRGSLEGVKLASDAVQDLGGEGKEFLVRLPLQDDSVENLTRTVTDALSARFASTGFEILRVESVGPRVGAVLREKAILAVIVATIMMGIYIWIRFQWRFGVGAAAALFHDVLVTLAFLILWNYEFDLTIVAAMLTIVGYSVNDTVIVSDRIRENLRKDRRSPLPDLINRSINETLSRTVLTAGTSILVVIALYVLGGNVIHGFAFTLLVGFIVGTYSSIFVASPVVLLLERFGSTAMRR